MQKLPDPVPQHSVAPPTPHAPVQQRPVQTQPTAASDHATGHTIPHTAHNSSTATQGPTNSASLQPQAAADPTAATGQLQAAQTSTGAAAADPAAAADGTKVPLSQLASSQASETARAPQASEAAREPGLAPQVIHTQPAASQASETATGSQPVPLDPTAQSARTVPNPSDVTTFSAADTAAAASNSAAAPRKADAQPGWTVSTQGAAAAAVAPPVQQAQLAESLHRSLTLRYLSKEGETEQGSGDAPARAAKAQKDTPPPAYLPGHPG